METSLTFADKSWAKSGGGANAGAATGVYRLADGGAARGPTLYETGGTVPTRPCPLRGQSPRIEGQRLMGFRFVP